MIKGMIKDTIKDLTMATILEGEGIGDRVFDVSHHLHHARFSSLSPSMILMVVSVLDG